LQHESTYLVPPILKNGISHTTPDELDVINLIEKAILFFNRFKFILLGFFITGLAAGLYLYSSSPKQFSTRMIVHSGFISNQDEIEIIESWQDLLKNKEYNRLAVIMNCDVKVIKNLKKISAEEILKTYVTNNPNGFLISVTVTDATILDDLQNGIVYGLNNTPYVKEKIEVKKARDIELIQKVNAEISKLDVTKNAIDNMIKTGGSTSSSLLVDISRINAQWIDLNERLLSYKEDLQFLAGVQVTQDFNKGKLERHGLLKFSFLGMATGCFFGYAISLFLYVLHKLKISRARSAATFG
jgi:hypothetical protein